MYVLVLGYNFLIKKMISCGKSYHVYTSVGYSFVLSFYAPVLYVLCAPNLIASGISWYWNLYCLQQLLSILGILWYHCDDMQLPFTWYVVYCIGRQIGADIAGEPAVCCTVNYLLKFGFLCLVQFCRGTASYSFLGGRDGGRLFPSSLVLHHQII
jgi:hypothetical protein